jgi:hypothetical protein
MISKFIKFEFLLKNFVKPIIYLFLYKKNIRVIKIILLYYFNNLLFYQEQELDDDDDDDEPHFLHDLLDFSSHALQSNDSLEEQVHGLEVEHEEDEEQDQPDEVVHE